MKKLFTLTFLLILYVTVFSQSLDSIMGEMFYIISPNGKYCASAGEGAAASLFNSETKERRHFDVLGDFGYFITAITNDGMLVGSDEQHAAFCKNGENWQKLGLPGGLTQEEKACNIINAVSADGKQMVVSFSLELKKSYVYSENDLGGYDTVRLPMPEKDPIYHMYPYWIGIRDISADGNAILGMFLTSDGMRQLPLLWTKSDDGTWTYKFLAINNLLKEGKTIPPYPYELTDAEGEIPDDVWFDWAIARDSVEAGVYYTMNGALMSGNGKYISLSVGIQKDNEPFPIMYGGVIDVENDSLCLFSSLENATCLSVTDNGIVTLGTPSKEYFRYGFVSSVDNPNNIESLNHWTNNYTKGAVDLSKHMTYVVNEQGDKNVVEGTAYFSKDGSAFITYINNMFSTGEWESFYVDLGNTTALEYVGKTEKLDLFPNPSTGLINITTDIENIVVYNITGQRVYSSEFVDKNIDLSHLLPGQYIVKGISDGKLYVDKIIIK